MVAATGTAADDWASARGDKWRAQLGGMEAMLAPVDGPLIDALAIDGPCRIADVGCGGGGTTFEVLRRAPAGTVVRGFDISPALIEVARARMAADPARVSFELADVSTASPPGQLFDRLVSRFGIMFFDDPLAAFSNLARWLVPGGRFAFAAWGRTDDNPWVTTARDAVAELVDVPRPGPDTPGPFRYGKAENLLAVLGQAGFMNLEVRDWQGSLAVGGGLSPAEAATFSLASFSVFGELLAAAGGDAFDRARRSLTARFADHQQAGVVRMDARVHIFTGARAR